jgi:glycosyltransferase involved in cell wall biosynthesis
VAAGTPVISTSLGVEGLPVDDGGNILLADSAEAFVRFSTALQPGSPQWASLARNGLQLVKERYDWSVSGQKLWQLYQPE